MTIWQAAVPAGSDNYEWLQVPQMDAALSYLNLMVLMALDYDRMHDLMRETGLRLRRIVVDLGEWPVNSRILVLQR